MDGGLGHGNIDISTGGKDTEGLKRDKIKDNLARKHGIKMIRIDCIVSDFDYIKTNIIKNLSCIFDLSHIDWNKINMYSMKKNIYKEICFYYDKHPKFLREISNDLNIGIDTVRSAVKVGNMFGWCNYESWNKFQEEKFYKLIDSWNTNKYIQTSVLAKKFNLGQGTVISYLKMAEKMDLCDYDPKKSQEYFFKNKKTFPVYVFDKSLNFIKSYKSSKECAENSIDDFGMKFNKRNIDYICNGKGKTYKGFYFSRNKEIDKAAVLEYINTLVINRNTKRVYVYDLSKKYCGEYNSVKELCEKSTDDFNVQFNSSNVSSVCTGKYKYHKGYIFSYVPLND